MRIETVGELIELLKEFGESIRVFTLLQDTILGIEETHEEGGDVFLRMGLNDDLIVGELIENLKKFDDSTKVYLLSQNIYFFIQELYIDEDNEVIIVAKLF
jgi:hypothetical protein